MWKLYAGLMVSFVAGTFLCIYGQSITYFLYDYYDSVSLPYMLTVITGTAYILYAVTGLLLYLIIKKQNFAYRNRKLFALLALLGMFLPANWALFVTAMWWG